MLFPLYCVEQKDYLFEAIKHIDQTKERDKKHWKGVFSQVTVFLGTPESEEEFVREFLRSSRYLVVGVAEKEELLVPFRQTDGCRWLTIRDSVDTFRVAKEVVRMMPTPLTETEGAWDGTVMLRRPSVSSLAVMSACARESCMLFLITTIVDPDLHLCTATLMGS